MAISRFQSSEDLYVMDSQYNLHCVIDIFVPIGSLVALSFLCILGLLPSPQRIRFHSLGEFDEGKRSCRKRLDGHNRRRRKPQPDSLSLNSGRFHSSYQGLNCSFGSIFFYCFQLQILIFLFIG